MRKLSLIIFLLIGCLISNGQTIKIGLLKYNGGGDWYANPTSLPNLIDFCNKNIHTNIHSDPVVVEAGSQDIFNYPLVHMTGHGNVLFTEDDVVNIRTYLEAGGFLHIDDNYGMNEFVIREMKKVFPEQKFIELPFNHDIYSSVYLFENGLPKIHEHDKKPPQGYGLFVKGRLVCFYTYECDLGDGWEDQEVHNDSKEVRTKALNMGANIVSYAFAN